MAFSMRLSSKGRSSMPPSSLALPVTAKADILRVSRRLRQRGQTGFLVVLTAREKKLKMVLHGSQ